MRSRVETHDRTREVQRRGPDRAVGRRGDSIEAGGGAFVFRGIDRLVGVHVGIALALALGVRNQGRPALWFFLIARLVEKLRVQPTPDRAPSPRPQGAGRV